MATTNSRATTQANESGDDEKATILMIALRGEALDLQGTLDDYQRI